MVSRILPSPNDENQTRNRGLYGAGARGRRNADGVGCIGDETGIYPFDFSTRMRGLRGLVQNDIDKKQTAGTIAPQAEPLTPREVEVLQLIAKGDSNKQIARELKIRDGTVKNYITNILRKLNVFPRTEAVREGVKRGLIKIPDEAEVETEAETGLAFLTGRELEVLAWIAHGLSSKQIAKETTHNRRHG